MLELRRKIVPGISLHQVSIYAAAHLTHEAKPVHCLGLAAYSGELEPPNRRNVALLNAEALLVKYAQVTGSAPLRIRP